MGIVTVSGEPGCRPWEVAHQVAQRLGFEAVSASRLAELLTQEFGEDASIPDKAWLPAAGSTLARLAKEAQLVLSFSGAELLFRGFSYTLRCHILAPENRRLGNLMLERRLDRAGARKLLRELEKEHRLERRNKFGRATAAAESFDLLLSADTLDTETMSSIVESAARAKGIPDSGLLSAEAEAQYQFNMRLLLAKHGLQPAERAQLKHAHFVHPSEQTFANLLDYYQIAWEYEPRSFPLQWDKNGNIVEAFTPDFYLPEFELYIELTTMKQAHVTRKNHKVKLLRAIYPDINIQIFYQKDFQDLIFKYGLAERK